MRKKKNDANRRALERLHCDMSVRPMLPTTKDLVNKRPMNEAFSPTPGPLIGTHAERSASYSHELDLIQPVSAQLTLDMPLQAVPLHLSANQDPIPTAGDQQYNAGQFACSHPGCRSKPFKRRGDLNRHVRGHNPQQRLTCPARDCKSACNRPDKLYDHVNNVHSEETEIACRIPGCEFTSSGALLTLHMKNHPRGWLDGDQRVYSKALQKGSETVQCPVMGCSVKSSRPEFPAHLLTYEQKEIDPVRQRIIVLGIDPNTRGIICPLVSCRAILLDLDEFHWHLVSHLVNDVDVGCLVQLRSECVRGRYAWAGKPCELYGIVAAQMQISTIDLAEIREHRVQLLRLCPCIGITNLYDDVIPSVQRHWYDRLV